MKHHYNTLKKVSMVLATLFASFTAAALAGITPYASRAYYLIGLVVGSGFTLCAVWFAKNW